MGDKNKTLSLLIISKFLYGKEPGQRYCYLGLDRRNGIIYRPVPSLGLEEKDFFWPPNSFSCEIGETHKFRIVPDQDPRMVLLPHRNNDIQVKQLNKIEKNVLDVNDMFEVLQSFSRSSIEEALGVAGDRLFYENRKPYVKEKEDCQSWGIYKCTSEEASMLSFHETEHNLPDKKEQDVLVIIETARPLKGKMNFSPPRCYLVEAGVVYLTQTGT